MWRGIRIAIGRDVLIAALFIAAGNSAALAADDVSAGRRLAEAWCSTCHAIEPHVAPMFYQAPSFVAIANRHGTTELSLKVFLKTSHRNMPNLMIDPDQANALADYILSLKTN